MPKLLKQVLKYHLKRIKNHLNARVPKHGPEILIQVL